MFYIPWLPAVINLVELCKASQYEFTSVNVHVKHPFKAVPLLKPRGHILSLHIAPSPLSSISNSQKRLLYTCKHLINEVEKYQVEFTVQPLCININLTEVFGDNITWFNCCPKKSFKSSTQFNIPVQCQVQLLEMWTRCLCLIYLFRAWLIWEGPESKRMCSPGCL